MSTLHPPEEAPPTYEAATGSSATGATTPARVSTDGPASHTARNGIPPEQRRSMEDEQRPLPPGWVRQFDSIEQHQFFVDTTSDPPRSTWLHPYDDPDYLATLPPSERQKHTRRHRSVTLTDLAAEDTDDEDHHFHPNPNPNPHSGHAPSPPPKGLHKFGRKMKDKLTSTTHTQREAARAERGEQERRAYAAHLRVRTAMHRALETGEPQFLCHDRDGRAVYIEPPPQRGPFGGYYGRVPGAAGRGGAYGFSPYAAGGGPYADPNVRFVRPGGPYGRTVGYGYGGGLGVPVAMGVLGGVGLGGLLF